MIARNRPAKQQTLLRRALEAGIRKPAPRAVMTWAQDYLRLPDADMRRMKKLYEKVMNETITAGESAELDSLMDACAAMDLLRARLMTAGTGERTSRSK